MRSWNRIAAKHANAARRQPYIVEYDSTGRQLSEWSMVEAEATETDEQFCEWIQQSADFIEALCKKRRMDRKAEV